MLALSCILAAWEGSEQERERARGGEEGGGREGGR